jgi:hypothetical protein
MYPAPGVKVAVATEERVMQERRKTARPRTYLTAQIIYNDRSSLMDCLVRNFSGTGAKLVFANTAAVPREFELLIPRDDRRLRARMVWRRPNEAGVAFEQAPRPTLPCRPAGAKPGPERWAI